MAYLYISCEQQDKTQWVACANRDGKTLEQWVTDLLNAEVSRNPPPPPKRSDSNDR
jgi:hypothetical protein